MNNDPETTWHSVREIPDRTLVIRKEKKGLSLEITPIYSVTGVRYICILMMQKYIWFPDRLLGL